MICARLSSRAMRCQRRAKGMRDENEHGTSLLGHPDDDGSSLIIPRNLSRVRVYPGHSSPYLHPTLHPGARLYSAKFSSAFRVT